MPEQIYPKPRHPSGTLNPPAETSDLWWVWGLLVVAGVAFALVAIFRPQWLARIGVQVNLSGVAKAVGAVSNPMGWV